jgi:hypothetical protein
MANRALYPSWSTGLNRVYCEFELLGAGASALTIPVDGGGAAFVQSVSRSGAGVFVVTMKDAWSKVVSKGADLDDTLNDGGYATMGTVTNEGTALPLTFTVRIRAAAGTLADPAAARRISIKLTMRNGVLNQGG